MKNITKLSIVLLILLFFGILSVSAGADNVTSDNDSCIGNQYAHAYYGRCLEYTHYYGYVGSFVTVYNGSFINKFDPDINLTIHNYTKDGDQNFTVRGLYNYENNASAFDISKYIEGGHYDVPADADHVDVNITVSGITPDGCEWSYDWVITIPHDVVD